MKKLQIHIETIHQKQAKDLFYHATATILF